MMRLLQMMGRNAPMVLVGGVVMGLLLPGLGGIIDLALPLLVVMLLAVAMVRVDMAQVVMHLRRPLRLIVLLVLLMVIIPVCVHLLATFFELSPVLHMALVLLVCAPPLSASANMAALLGLDDALVLNVIVVGTMIVPLSAPVLINTIVSIPIVLDATTMFLKLALVIGLSIGTAMIMRRMIGRDKIEENLHVLDGVSALIMVIFAIVVMNGIAVTYIQSPWELLTVLGAVLVVNWGLHGLTCLAFLGYRKATGNGMLTRQDGALALMSGNRNMALIVAILPPETAADLFLFLAMYQVPIYLTPILARPLYGRHYRG